jgi:hypothetical protein
LFGAQLKVKYAPHSLSVIEQQSTNEQDDGTQEINT